MEALGNLLFLQVPECAGSVFRTALSAMLRSHRPIADHEFAGMDYATRRMYLANYGALIYGEKVFSAVRAARLDPSDFFKIAFIPNPSDLFAPMSEHLEAEAGEIDLLVPEEQTDLALYYLARRFDLPYPIFDAPDHSRSRRLNGQSVSPDSRDRELYERAHARLNRLVSSLQRSDSRFATGWEFYSGILAQMRDGRLGGNVWLWN